MNLLILLLNIYAIDLALRVPDYERRTAEERCFAHEMGWIAFADREEEIAALPEEMQKAIRSGRTHLVSDYKFPRWKINEMSIELKRKEMEHRKRAEKDLDPMNKKPYYYCLQHKSKVPGGTCKYAQYHIHPGNGGFLQPVVRVFWDGENWRYGKVIR